MSRASPKQGQMCVVAVGYQYLLMPATDGMKLVALLQHSCLVEHDYKAARADRYLLREQPEVSLTLIKPDQVIAPDKFPKAGEVRRLAP